LTFENQSLISFAEQQLQEGFMNKGDLIEALKEATGLTRNIAETAVDIFFAKMTDTLVEGDRVKIRGSVQHLF
jgi:hypothetical protein